MLDTYVVFNLSLSGNSRMKMFYLLSRTPFPILHCFAIEVNYYLHNLKYDSCYIYQYNTYYLYDFYKSEFIRMSRNCKAR